MRPPRRAGGLRDQRGQDRAGQRGHHALPRGEAAAAAEATAREVFEKGGAGDDLPTLTLSAAEVGDGISVAQLITRSGLAKSGKEAKRLIADGGARMNDVGAHRCGPDARRRPTWPTRSSSAPGKSVTRWSCSRPDPLHLSKNTAGERRRRGGGAPKTARLSPECGPRGAMPDPQEDHHHHARGPGHHRRLLHDARPRDTLPHTRHGRGQNQRTGHAQQHVDPHAKRPRS
jgi:hypothetical protein